MSPGISTFSARDDRTKFLDNKRMRKANLQEYNKNVHTARRTRAMREEARYNADNWEYTSKGLYDKFAGKINDPNIHNRGITGFTFSPEGKARQLKMKDINSGNIEFDTEKVIA